jgi:hypothetical protein
VAHGVARERELGAGEGGLAAAPLARLVRLLGAERRYGRVVAGEHQGDARHPLRRRHVDRADARMGVRRAQHVAAQHPGLAHVVHIAADPAQQVGILLARHRLPNPVFTHGRVLCGLD